MKTKIKAITIGVITMISAVAYNIGNKAIKSGISAADNVAEKIVTTKTAYIKKTGTQTTKLVRISTKKYLTKKTINQIEDLGLKLVENKNGAIKILKKESNEIVGTIYGNRITCVPGMSKATSNILLNQAKLIPNFTYKVDQAIYKTDAFGRVIEAKIGRFTKNYYPGKYAHSDVILKKDGIPGDHAGHLIARNLGGVSEMINYVPQHSYLNQSDIFKVENYVSKNRKFIKDYSVRLIYKDKSMRPDKVLISYVEKGQNVIKGPFINKILE